MSSEALDAIRKWSGEGRRAALATVVATRRSAPRPLGSRLAVSEAGELAGSVSGGCVESDVALHAREVIDTGRPKLVTYGIPDEDAWEVGLPCGGEIDVFLERFEGRLPDPGTPQVIFTVVDGDRAGERWVSDDGEVTRTQLLERDGERVFAEVLGPPPRLLIFGAVDLAEALSWAAKGLGWAGTCRRWPARLRAKPSTSARLDPAAPRSDGESSCSRQAFRRSSSTGSMGLRVSTSAPGRRRRPRSRSSPRSSPCERAARAGACARRVSGFTRSA